MAQGLDKLADSLGHIIMTEDGAIISVRCSLVLIIASVSYGFMLAKQTIFFAFLCLVFCHTFCSEAACSVIYSFLALMSVI
jgi:hypothetical protein